MANDFPTSPAVLSEASPYSLNDLAIMSPGEMSPGAELAYIEHLRSRREQYEKALGTTRASATRATKPAARVAAVLAGPSSDISAEDLF